MTAAINFLQKTLFQQPRGNNDPKLGKKRYKTTKLVEGYLLIVIKFEITILNIPGRLR